MFTKSARFYDALYAFKNYEDAAARLLAMARSEHPSARSLLDVGCGTGRHLEYLRRCYESVEGIDINPNLLAIARERLPGVLLHQADMTQFRLGRRFDLVTCLFSSIAYVRTADALRSAVSAMAGHLNPGGLLLLEPWFTPENYWVGHLAANSVDDADLKISWMYVSALRDSMSVLDIHFQVGTPAGIEQFREVHELGLFTMDEYIGSFRAAGLEPRQGAGFFGRGLYWARAGND